MRGIESTPWSDTIRKSGRRRGGAPAAEVDSVLSLSVLIEKIKAYNDDADLSLVGRRIPSPGRRTRASIAIRATSFLSILTKWPRSWRTWSWTSRPSSPASSTTWSRTRDATPEELEADSAPKIVHLVDGVTKLSKIPFPDQRRAPGRELPQDVAGDGRGHARHPDQARRPPAQHAHARAHAAGASSSASRRRRWRSTRRWPTASGIVESRASWRTWRFRYLEPEDYYDLGQQHRQEAPRREKAISRRS